MVSDVLLAAADLTAHTVGISSATMTTIAAMTENLRLRMVALIMVRLQSIKALPAASNREWRARRATSRNNAGS
jgi:hypothetical protein